MVRINDHYFVAWLKIKKNFNFTIVDNKVMVDMSPLEYSEAKIEYEQGLKPVLKQIREIVKQLAAVTSKSNKDNFKKKVGN